MESTAPLLEEPEGTPAPAENIVPLPGADGTPAPKGKPAPKEEDEEKKPVKFQGRCFYLYKLVKQGTPGYRDAWWYIRARVGKGERPKKCLETNHWDTAADRAKVWLAKVLSGKWEDTEKLKMRSPVSKLAALGEIYVPDDKMKPHLSIATCSRASAENAWYALGRVVRVGLGYESPTDPVMDPKTGKWTLRVRSVSKNEMNALNKRVREEVSLNDINEVLCDKFQEALVTRYCAAAGDNKDRKTLARETALRSSRSLINQARQVFRSRGADLRPKYEERGLKIPDCVEGFLKAKLKGSNTKTDYFAPPDEVMEGILNSSDELKKTAEGEPLYLMFWLDLGAGLRKSEILRARWEHFLMRGGKPWFSASFDLDNPVAGKDKKLIEVPIQERAWQNILPLRKSEGLVLGNRATEQTAKDLNKWIRLKGLNTTRLAMGELRAYVGSKLFAVDPQMAQVWMRHKRLQTTESRYKRYAKIADVPNVL
jgi:integrase